jgi:hypothetical protein
MKVDSLGTEAVSAMPNGQGRAGLHLKTGPHHTGLIRAASKRNLDL